MTFLTQERANDLRGPAHTLTLLQWLNAARAVARQRRALRQLDQHGLRDIGLSAKAAEKEANRPLWDLPNRS